MGETITLELPEETVERYRRSAELAHRPLEEFLVDRLVYVAPPPTGDLPEPMRSELRELAGLSDDEVWQIARSRFPSGKQRVLTRLLHRNSDGTITPRERETLRNVSEEARRLTLRKAQAYTLLKQRGYRLPSREELEQAG